MDSVSAATILGIFGSGCFGFAVGVRIRRAQIMRWIIAIACFLICGGCLTVIVVWPRQIIHDDIAAVGIAAIAAMILFLIGPPIVPFVIGVLLGCGAKEFFRAR